MLQYLRLQVVRWTIRCRPLDCRLHPRLQPSGQTGHNSTQTLNSRPKNKTKTSKVIKYIIHLDTGYKYFIQLSNFPGSPDHEVRQQT